ncbi:MAG: TVP38/TMEM64 family protein [Fibrobacter sp.]|nr:TVP38/TMEM64 family protein [Fibrobacter sp.]
MKKFNWLHLLPIIITVLIIGTLILSWFLSPRVQSLSNEAWSILQSGNRELLRDWVSQFGEAGVIVLLFFFLVQMFAFVIPSWALVVVSVLAYGPLIGGIVALAGTVLAASVAYWIGRLFSEFTIKKILKQKSEKKMRVYLQRYGFWVVVIFKLAPFLSNDIISYAAGLVSMSFPRFFLASVVGTSPLVILIAFLGETNERLWNGFIVVSVVSIIGFVIYVWWDQKQQPQLST